MCPVRSHVALIQSIFRHYDRHPCLQSKKYSTCTPKVLTQQQQELGCALNMINMEDSYCQCFFSWAGKITIQTFEMSTNLTWLHFNFRELQSISAFTFTQQSFVFSDRYQLLSEGNTDNM